MPDIPNILLAFCALNGFPEPLEFTLRLGLDLPYEVGTPDTAKAGAALLKNELA
jgi:hypothetical protein